VKSRVGIWILSVRGADGSPTAGTVMLAVIPFMLGIQMLLVALQLDIQESPKLPTLPPLSLDPPTLLGGSDGECSCDKQG